MFDNKYLIHPALDTWYMFIRYSQTHPILLRECLQSIFAKQFAKQWSHCSHCYCYAVLQLLEGEAHKHSLLQSHTRKNDSEVRWPWQLVMKCQIVRSLTVHLSYSPFIIGRWGSSLLNNTLTCRNLCRSAPSCWKWSHWNLSINVGKAYTVEA